MGAPTTDDILAIMDDDEFFDTYPEHFSSDYHDRPYRGGHSSKPYYEPPTPDHHHHHFSSNQPPPGFLPTKAPNATLPLALLLSTAFTLLYHSDLALLLLYWLLRPLRLTPASYPSILLPAALRPLPNGLTSPYWATLHALRWDVRRNREALGWWLLTFFFLYFVLAGFPREVGDGVMGLVGPPLWAAAEVYLHLAVSCLGVSWWLGGVWVVWQVVLFTGWAAVRAVGDLVVAWARFLRENWAVVFVAFAGWVSWTLVVEVDYGVVWRETAEWVLLQCAGLVYVSGDVVRDTASMIELRE